MYLVGTYSAEKRLKTKRTHAPTHIHIHSVLSSPGALSRSSKKGKDAAKGRAGDTMQGGVDVNIFACNMMVKFIQFSNLVAFQYARHQISSCGYILRGISILYTWFFMVFHVQILLCRYHVSSTSQGLNRKSQRLKKRRLLRSMSG